MPKPKSNLNALLDDIPPAPVAAPTTRSPRARSVAPVGEGSEQTAMVGANLPPQYARNLAFLHAETGRSKKELLQEALDLLFRSKGGPNLKM